MTTALNWNVVTSIGTAAASIVALTALLVTIIIYVIQRNEDRAALIREDIRSFTGATSRLVRQLEDGSPLISASWYATDTIRDRLSDNLSIEAIIELLAQDGVGLSIGVVSWGKSPDAENLRNTLAEQLTASRRLTGHLNILSEAGDMLQGMAQDVNMTFIRLLNDRQIRVMFLKDTKGITEVGPFLSAIATSLHGNTAMYFAARYIDAIRLLNELISLTATTTIEFGARELISAARSKSLLYEDETRTAAMRRALTSLERSMPGDVAAKIAALIDKLEHAISKEAASKRLHEGSIQQ